MYKKENSADYNFAIGYAIGRNQVEGTTVSPSIFALAYVEQHKGVQEFWEEYTSPEMTHEDILNYLLRHSCSDPSLIEGFRNYYVTVDTIEFTITAKSLGNGEYEVRNVK